MKVLLLGIDALDRLLLEQFAGDLPTLNAMRTSATSLPVKSTFPPDSDTAWATIMTGLNPAQHGIVRFVDPLEKSYQLLNVAKDNSILRGKTFWEIIGQAGYKAHAIFPHLCYPVWPTPSTMVARSSAGAGIQSTIPELLAHYPSQEMIAGVNGFPDPGISALAERSRLLTKLTMADAEFGLRLMDILEWDLFFVYWSTLDAIGHFFWSYFDPDDPGFQEGHPFQQIIPDTYKLYDKIVGQFLAAVDDEVTVIVLSDHGHGTRPFTLVNVNEVLHQAGFLAARDLKSNPHLNLLEKSKRLAVKGVSRFGLGKAAGQIMRNFPGVVQTFTRPASVNWEKTLAYATDMSGIKSYSYGGIMINRAALARRDYEKVRSELISLLQEACVLSDGTPLLEFIIRREELFAGPYLDKYPDILLEFKYGYGVGWAVHVPLITHAAAHNVMPGSHRGATGTFLMRSTRSAKHDTFDLMDTVPTLLDLMSIPAPDKYEGKSILSTKQPTPGRR